MSNDIKMPAKNSPFRNIKMFVDGRWFDSKGEAKRYVDLVKDLHAGKIRDLRCQVPFQLSDCIYIADFVYKQNGVRVVEDYKGLQTDVFKRKRRLMKKELGITILLSHKPNVHSKLGKRRSKKSIN